MPPDEAEKPILLLTAFTGWLSDLEPSFQAAEGRVRIAHHLIHQFDDTAIPSSHVVWKTRDPQERAKNQVAAHAGLQS